MAQILTLVNHLFFGLMRGLAQPVFFLQNQHLQLPTPEAFNFMICLFPAELTFFSPRWRPRLCLFFPSLLPRRKPTWLSPLRPERVDRQTENSFQRYFSGFAQWQVGGDERAGLSPQLGLHQPVSSLSTLWEAPQTPACRSELTWSIPAAPRYISRPWEM